MLTETAIPTVEDIEKIVNDARNFIDNGAYRSVYRDGESRWIIKVDREGGIVNQREYDNYVKLSPSLTNPSVRLPEMHMVGQYLIAEYIEGSNGSAYCWNISGCKRKNGKAHYVGGCDNKGCADKDNCWAELTREISEHVADIHYANVRITEDKIVYVIDLGEH